MKLNLGCGKDKRKDWVNLDIKTPADILWDLDSYPYPFKDNVFEEIEARMILEHLDNPIKAIKEIVRIAKSKAIIRIIVPHANSYANNTDIQHKTNFTENSFTETMLEKYDISNLKLIKQEFLFGHKWKRFIPFKNFWKIWLNGIYDDLLFEFEVKK